MRFVRNIVWIWLVGGWLSEVGAQVVFPPDRDALTAGKSDWTVLAAEVSGLPGPKEVLKYQNILGLTRDQIRKTEALEKVTMNSAAAKGEEIILEEESLPKLFEAGSVSEKNLRAKLEHCAKLRADLQFIHLQSHLRVRQILTPQQLEQYKALKADEK